MMKTHNFRNEDLITFTNKILEGLRVTLRATEVLPYAPGAESIQLKGPDVLFSAKISDFGMGDIGFEALRVLKDTVSKTFRDVPALEARLLPRAADFLSYQTDLNGPDIAKSKLASISALSSGSDNLSKSFQMSDVVKVINNDQVMTLAQYVVDRPRPSKNIESTTLSM